MVLPCVVCSVPQEFDAEAEGNPLLRICWLCIRTLNRKKLDVKFSSLGTPLFYPRETNGSPRTEMDA